MLRNWHPVCPNSIAFFGHRELAMPIVLYFIMSLISQATLTLGEVTVASQNVAKRQSSLDGTVSQDHVVFVVSVPSLIACVTICMQHERCFAMTTSPTPTSSTLTCHGYGSMQLSNSKTKNIAGSKTYVICKQGICEQWLERPCASHSDCPTANHVECFTDAGQCLCTPGYYYSYSLNDCIQDCPVLHLQSTYLRYPNRKIVDGNIVIKGSGYSLEQCKIDCSADTRRVTFDFSHDGYCCLQDVDALDTPTMFSYSTVYDQYQKTCL